MQYMDPFLSEFDMVDPYREQNPNKRIWSFIGTGKAGKSRIDRIYADSEEMRNIKMNYMETPFHGHKILNFSIKSCNEHGKGFYKMNTSILKDSQYRDMINELLENMSNMETQDPIHKWQTFILMTKSRSITYSKLKGKIKRNLKNRFRHQICKLEEDPDNLKKEHN